MLVIRGQQIKNFALQKEWLESNLNGSYVYNNLLGSRGKPEHSWLTIFFEKKVRNLISSIKEEFNIEGQTYLLNEAEPDTSHCSVKNYLEKFYIDYNPNFVYNFNGIKFIKSVVLIHDKNIIAFKYKMISGEKEAQLKLSPFMPVPEIDADGSSGQGYKYNSVKEGNYVKIYGPDKINIFFYFQSGEFLEVKKNIQNTTDAKSYYKPGDFLNNFNSVNNECYFLFSDERIKETDLSVLFNNEVQRRKNVIENLSVKNELYKNIILSSDFYIKKENKIYLLKNSILISSLSFQVMINSLNILFVLKKNNIIKDCLKYLIDKQEGAFTEFFTENGNKNINSGIDNPFWYLINLLKFIEFTGDWKFVKDHIWPNIKHIMSEFINDHIMNIKIDSDGLLVTQDVFNKGMLIEYQEGKHSILNILWYNAVKITELLAAKFADIKYHMRMEEMAERIKNSFYMKFWNNDKGYFNYRVEISSQNEIDDSLRPYQIFTMSLPFDDLIYYKIKQRILFVMQDKLLSPAGILTLSPDSADYNPVFDPQKPSSAYNGIVHPYILFHYIISLLKINNYSKSKRKEVKSLLLNFEKKIKTNIIGFFPQFLNSDTTYNSSGFLDYSLTLSEYLRVRSDELNSI